jgi:hypothetical protein
MGQEVTSTGRKRCPGTSLSSEHSPALWPGQPADLTPGLYQVHPLQSSRSGVRVRSAGERNKLWLPKQKGAYWSNVRGEGKARQLGQTPRWEHQVQGNLGFGLHHMYVTQDRGHSHWLCLDYNPTLAG